MLSVCGLIFGPTVKQVQQNVHEQVNSEAIVHWFTDRFWRMVLRLQADHACSNNYEYKVYCKIVKVILVLKGIVHVIPLSGPKKFCTSCWSCI